VGPPRSYPGCELEAVRRAGRLWGERPVAVRIGGEARVVYYALGKVLRTAIALGSRPAALGMCQWGEPTLDAWL